MACLDSGMVENQCPHHCRSAAWRGQRAAVRDDPGTVTTLLTHLCLIQRSTVQGEDQPPNRVTSRSEGPLVSSSVTSRLAEGAAWL